MTRHPAEIANMALFLASGNALVFLWAAGVSFTLSDESSYVNGQNMAVDGGLSASHPVAPGKWA